MPLTALAIGAGSLAAIQYLTAIVPKKNMEKLEHIETILDKRGTLIEDAQKRMASSDEKFKGFDERLKKQRGDINRISETQKRQEEQIKKLSAPQETQRP